MPLPRYTVSIGKAAGDGNQRPNSIAIGSYAGHVNQGLEDPSSQVGDGGSAVGIGEFAGFDDQGPRAVAMGAFSGAVNQGTNAVAIGTFAGAVNQGSNAVAIGNKAGFSIDALGISNDGQAANSIVINATGDPLNNFELSGSCFIKPIRQTAPGTSGLYTLAYNPATGELTYFTQL